MTAWAASSLLLGADYTAHRAASQAVLDARGRGELALLPQDGGGYRHHRGGEDNGDAHLKNLLTHQQVVLPITGGKLDLGPWQAVFYCEFDGQRDKRLIIKVLGA